MLARVLMVTQGYSAPEMRAAAERARDLAEKTGTLDQMVVQAYGIWTSVLSSGDYTTAGLLADEILNLAQREGSPASLGFACRAQLEVSFIRGDFVESEEHYLRGRSFLDAEGLKQVPGAAMGIMVLSCLCAWALGHANSARERMARVIAYGRNSNSPGDLAFGRLFEGWLSCLLREPQRAEVAFTQLSAIADEHGFALGGKITAPMLGWARAQLGRAAEGVALIRQGLADLAEIGFRYGITDFLTRLAEAQALDGKLDDAFSTIEEALQANPEELAFRPNALICRAELWLKLGQTELAEADFCEAIALAKKMQAKAWELRATMSLARLLARQLISIP
jgi:tetratricopeptide (TPR) repeat protein